jgi:transcriptional regulator with XRE-family HTH domain
LLERYEQGATTAQLAESYGISRTAVKDLLHRQGVAVRRPVGLGAGEIDEAVRLYRAGWLLREIAEKFGVSQETMRRKLLGRGVVMPSGHGDHHCALPAQLGHAPRPPARG